MSFACSLHDHYPVPERAATIEIEQLANGYWHCAVRVVVPGLSGAHLDSGSAFHNARECIEWATGVIEAVVLHV